MAEIAEPSKGPNVSDFMRGLGNIDEPAAVAVVDENPPLPPPAASQPAAEKPKAPENKPVISVEPPKPQTEEEKWPRNAKDWESFRAARKQRETELSTERDSVRTELDNARKELESARKSGASSEELTKLKAERDEFSNALRVLDVQSHPQFKAHFDGRTSQTINQGKSIVGEANASKFEQIVKLPEGEYKSQQLGEFISGLDTLQTARLGGVLNQLDQINSEKQQAIETETKNYETVQQRRKTESETANKKAQELAEQTFNTTLKELSGDKGLMTLQKREGADADEWNKDVDTRVEYARSLLTGKHKPDEIARAALYAASTPAVFQYAQTVATENATLREQIKALSAAQPGNQGGGNPAPQGANPVENKPNTNPMAAAENFMKGFKDAMRDVTGG